jgi:hypothetical protein
MPPAFNAGSTVSTEGNAMTYIKPIVGIFAVAGLSIIVTGCEPLEAVLKVANNGQPMPGGPSPSVAVYVSPTPSVERVEVALEDVPAPPCTVPASAFRTHWCNPWTGVYEIAP